ncbi:IS66 family insertion sequence element accessory protein TnpB [Paraburkholderia bannensis]|uniref:IS66 family insertion sequence element accessory protein TnpB n=1 Tax=Paraburkholderia bannensis TaxID=765414 RepID=UPI0038BBBE52
MSVLSSHTRGGLAAGVIDNAQAQQPSRQGADRTGRDPLCGDVFVFSGKRGDLLKVLWWRGDGMCVLMRRLKKGALRLATNRPWCYLPKPGATMILHAVTGLIGQSWSKPAGHSQNGR